MKKFKNWIYLQKVKLNEYKFEKKTIKFKKTVSSCGKNLQLFSIPETSFPLNLKIGNDCKINSGVYINARSGVTISDNVTLSRGVQIISTGYDIDHWMSTGKKMHFTDQPIFIGNHCWICSNAIILPGVKITGEFVVIGAGAIVTKDIVESNVIVAGNPATIIKRYKQNNQE